MSSAGHRNPGSLADDMLQLAYPRLWFFAGILLVLGIMTGSLLPGDYVEKAMVWNDKVTHALAYTGLTLWFTGIYARRRYPWVVLALVGFSALIEVLQSIMPFGRHGDAVDLLANSIGVGIGVLVALLWLGGWSQWAESRLLQVFAAR